MKYFLNSHNKSDFAGGSRQDIEQDLEQVRKIVTGELERPGGLISRGLLQFSRRKSKYLRPALVLACADVAGVPGASKGGTFSAAAALEMLHMASLIHDDILDGAHERRGGPAIHRLYDSRCAVLMGDYLFARAFYLLGRHAHPAAVAYASSAVGHLVRAEIDPPRLGVPPSDCAAAGGASGAEKSIRRAIRHAAGKTGVLFVLACSIGSPATSHTDEGRRGIAETLRRYGYNLGVAFQIVDDILDIVGDPTETGKPPGSDLRTGLVTLPMILAGNESAEGESPIDVWFDHAARDQLNEELVSEARGWIESTGGTRRAWVIAERYTERARKELQLLPPGRGRNQLQALTDAVLRRSVVGKLVTTRTVSHREVPAPRGGTLRNQEQKYPRPGWSAPESPG